MRTDSNTYFWLHNTLVINAVCDWHVMFEALQDATIIIIIIIIIIIKRKD